MTGFRLFVRSRRLAVMSGVLVLISLAGVVVGQSVLQVREGSDVALPWLIFLPLGSACVIAMSLRSALHEFDSVAARRMEAWRAGQIGALSVVALLGVLAMTANLSGSFTTTAAIRNFVGFLGLALACGRLIGARLSWIAPVVWVVVATTLGDPRSQLPPWDWPVRYDGDFGAAVAALGLVVIGVTLAVSGVNEVRGEEGD